MLFNANAILCFTSIAFVVGEAVNIDMRIVDEVSSYGGYYNMAGVLDQGQPIKMRVQPANVSGPVHLHYLKHHCFSKIINSYKYKFCPFSNISQHEEPVHWHSYNGILGVWQEWTIENNTFVAMEMTNGDDCGEVRRSVQVRMMCGNRTQIANVEEPMTCHYIMSFTTPSVCHSHSLLVYPTLPAPLRHRWDQLEGQLFRRELTNKGYARRLQTVMQEAGLRLPKQQQVETSGDEQRAEVLNVTSFDQLSAMYKGLQDEVKRLGGDLAVCRKRCADMATFQLHPNGTGHANISGGLSITDDKHVLMTFEKGVHSPHPTNLAFH